MSDQSVRSKDETSYDPLIQNGTLSGLEQTGLLTVPDRDEKELTLTSELGWFRNSICKLVQGGVYLLAGQPGIGKSRLALQLALDLGRQGLPSLYVLTEEPKSAIAARARMIASNWPLGDLNWAMSLVEPEDTIYDLANLPTFFGHQVVSHNGRYRRTRLIIVDSIQGHGMSSTATRHYRQIYQFARQCKAEGITALLVTHVTKTGEIAGPKDLQHNVDCVLYMRKALSYRPLFVPKNRFGPAVLQPIPLEMDGTTTALRPSPHTRSVSSVARTFLGRDMGIGEAQAAVSLPTYGTRGRIVAPGLPRKEIEQLLACISQIPDMDISDLSYSIQCRLAGERRYRRVLDLPLALALIASYVHREIPEHHLYMGELDLLRRVRDIPDPLGQDLSAALDLGEIPAVTIFCARNTAPLVSGASQRLTVVACDRLEDAMYATWPDLASTARFPDP